MWNRSEWATLTDEIAAFLLSAGCAGCDAPGTLLCMICRQMLDAVVLHRQTPAGLPVVAALRYEGVPARCIRRLKEEGETLLARPLGVTLRAALAALVPEGPAPLLVPIPTSHAAFRRRGYRVPEVLIRRAGGSASRLLTLARKTADQRGLDVADRRRNVAYSMRVRHARNTRKVVLIDDVVTTGATLDEGARALNNAGFSVLGAVTLAATARRDKYKYESIMDDP